MSNIVILMGALPYPRMYKRIQLESQLGELHLVCWDRGSNMLDKPLGGNYKTHLIHENATDDPLKRLIPYAKVFHKAYNIIKEIHPKVIHVEGMDMLKVAVKYKRKIDSTCKIIYEVGDLHRLIADKQHGYIRKAARYYLRREDIRLSSYYDLLIITSEQFYNIYFKNFIDKKKVLCIPNAPELRAFDSYRKKVDGEFTVGYIGSIRYKKQIHLLLEAAQRCNVNLVFAGYEQEPIEIEPLCRDKANITWIGKFDFNQEAARIYGMCDVVYSVYDAGMSNVRVALPNKLYESIYCELPIIVAKNTYLEKVTTDWGVGVAVNHEDVNDLVWAIEELQNKEVYSKIVENCKLAQNKFNSSKSNEILAKIVQNYMIT